MLHRGIGSGSIRIGSICCSMHAKIHSARRILSKEFDLAANLGRSVSSMQSNWRVTRIAHRSIRRHMSRTLYNMCNAPGRRFHNSAAVPCSRPASTSGLPPMTSVANTVHLLRMCLQEAHGCDCMYHRISERLEIMSEASLRSQSSPWIDHSYLVIKRRAPDRDLKVDTTAKESGLRDIRIRMQDRLDGLLDEVNHASVSMQRQLHERISQDTQPPGRRRDGSVGHNARLPHNAAHRRGANLESGARPHAKPARTRRFSTALEDQAVDGSD